MLHQLSVDKHAQTSTPFKISQKVLSQTPRFPERKRFFPPLPSTLTHDFWLLQLYMKPTDPEHIRKT